MIDRRRFIKTLGLTGSAALVEQCASPPAEQLVSSVVAPNDTTPGVPSYYATSCRACPAGCGMVATVIDGRVTKVEGNPAHPISRGRLCARGQATVQSLYNPDRFGLPRAQDAHGVMRSIGWDDAEAVLATHLRQSKTRGANRIAWIGGLATGQFDALVDAWLHALGSDRRVVYEAFDHEPLRAAGELAFGRREVPRYAFERARHLLAFGADFLETWISNVEFASGFADMRRASVGEKGGCFTWIAPRRSLTGLNADAWIAPPPGAEVLVALAIAQSMVANHLTHASAAPHLPWIERALAPFAASRVRARTEIEPAVIDAVARQFASASPSLAVGGGISGAGEHDAVTLDAAVLLLNVLAGNIGMTLSYGAGYAYDRVSPRASLESLTRAMSDGQIDVLLVHGTNPCLTLPASLGFTAALRRVPLVVTFSNTPDETSDAAQLVLPDHHFLESWGDYSPRAGVDNLLQPAAAPLLHSRATGDVLLEVAKQVDETAVQLLGQERWSDRVRRQWADDDVRAGGRHQEAPAAEVTLRDVSTLFDPARLLAAPPRAGDDALTLIAHPSPHYYDGRTANEPWLREVPDAATGIVWNGWVEIHPEAARALHVVEGDVVGVESPHGGLQATAHLSADVRRDVIAIPIGLGRSSGLRFAGGRGANVAALLPAHAADGPHAAWQAAVRLRRMPGQRRVIALAAAPTELASPRPHDHAATAGPSAALYPPHAHPQHRWGMAIDLNVCTGCSACVVACYAENNIPVAGEEGCAQGREMSWIRIERGTGAFMPMLCQQCDDAPCEAVCPVNATYHNPEGLNAQIYNRCIGTRFCSNNCPYKVRRFNFERPSWTAPLDLQLNPDVTVRSVGVMEKCTFCVQRINDAKREARREGRALRDGDITPACAQTCPTEAIVFGDLHDPGSRVSQLSADARGFRALDELGTRPAITYLRHASRGALDDA